MTIRNTTIHNYLNHLIWLRSTNESYPFNSYNVSQLMSKIEFMDRGDINMHTVEAILYSFISGSFRRSPYINFEPAEYQNAYLENDDVIEEIKFLCASISNQDTTYFNENVKLKHKDFNLKLNFEKDVYVD